MKTVSCGTADKSSRIEEEIYKKEMNREGRGTLKQQRTVHSPMSSNNSPKSLSDTSLKVGHVSALKGPEWHTSCMIIAIEARRASHDTRLVANINKSMK